MLVGTLDLKTVTLHPDKLWLEQEKDMTLFQITNHRLIFTNSSNPKQGMRMIVVMKRKIMSEIMTTYFPSILLTLITFATTFFKRIYFEASLSVNLTTMLVMTTIFISKMEGLPPTSATKMIDYWLIIWGLVPFAQVVLLTAIEYLREEEMEESEDNRKEAKDPMSEQKQGPDPKDAWEHPIEETRDVGTQIEEHDRELKDDFNKMGHILSRLILIGKLYIQTNSANNPLHPQRKQFSPLQSLLPSSSTLLLP